MIRRTRNITPVMIPATIHLMESGQEADPVTLGVAVEIVTGLRIFSEKNIKCSTNNTHRVPHTDPLTH